MTWPRHCAPLAAGRQLDDDDLATALRDLRDRATSGASAPAPALWRRRGVLAARLADSIAPVITNSATNWKSLSHDDLARAACSGDWPAAHAIGDCLSVDIRALAIEAPPIAIAAQMR